MLRTTTSLILCALAAWASADRTVQLTFDREASRVVFLSSDWPRDLPPNPELKSELSTKVVVTPKDEAGYLVVWDRDLNNLSVRPLKDIKDSWPIKDADLNMVGFVKVHIESQGKPVGVAQVQFNSKTRAWDRLIDPASKGEIRLFGVEPGELKVTAKYRTQSRDGQVKQGFDLALQRTNIEPVLVVVIQDLVEPAPSSGSAKSSDPKQEKSAETPVKTNGFNLSTALIVFLGLGAAIGAGAYFLIWANKNPGKLKSLGVPISDPLPPPGTDPASGIAPVAPVNLEPEPVQQILLGDGAPTPLGGAPVAMVSQTVASSNAPTKLTGEAGQSLNFTDGEHFVGRDGSLDFGMPTESTISRKHAQISVSNGVIQVLDLGSTNGTFVNGAKITVATPLRVGDVVQFGSVRFRVEG